MKVKKILALLMSAATMITMFAACGKGDGESKDSETKELVSQMEKQDDTNPSVENNEPVQTVGITSKESFVNTVDKLIDLSKYGSLSESTGGTTHSFSYTMKYEERSDYDLDGKVRLVDGTEFVLPVSVPSLESRGWEIPQNNRPDETFASGLETTAQIRNTSGKGFDAFVYNDTGSSIAIKNAKIGKVTFEQYSSLDNTKKLDSATPFTVCGTITEKSDLEDIVGRLGDPTFIGVLVKYENGSYKNSKVIIRYEQANSHNQIEFELSGDSDYIIKMGYGS